MIHEILLMTKSKMLNGYCITGIDADSRQWRRIKYQGCSSFPRERFVYENGDEPELLDTIFVDLSNECGTNIHPEDIYINNSDYGIRKKGKLSDFNILKDKLNYDLENREFIYLNNRYKLYEEELEQYLENESGSLLLIQPEEFHIRKDNQGKILARFRFKGHPYFDFRVTDTDFIKKFEKIDNNTGVDFPGKWFLVISLGTSFFNQMNGRIERYKLVAAVISESDITEKTMNY